MPSLGFKGRRWQNWNWNLDLLALPCALSTLLIERISKVGEALSPLKRKPCNVEKRRP